MRLSDCLKYDKFMVETHKDDETYQILCDNQFYDHFHEFLSRKRNALCREHPRLFQLVKRGRRQLILPSTPLDLSEIFLCMLFLKVCSSGAEAACFGIYDTKFSSFE